MTLKLNGSSSGYVAIDAPAAAGSNTLVLPADNGSNGEFLQTNGSGTLDWAVAADTKGLIKTVHNYKTDTFSSTAQDAWTDITGVTLTNTPASASNKHMGVFYVNWGRGHVNHFITGFRVTRSIGGATATVVSNSVAAGTSGGAANYQSQMHGMRAMYDANGTTTTAISLYDAPSTTSACVYQVQFYSEQGPHTFYLNRSHGDTTVSGRGTYQGILQEVSV